MRRSESAVDMADRDLQTILYHSPDGNATIDSSDDDQEQTESVESSGWTLESVTTGKGTESEETKEAGGKPSVKMVEVETARDEYEGMWEISPKHIDSPAELIEDNDRSVFWRYRDGVAISGNAEIGVGTSGKTGATCRSGTGGTTFSRMRLGRQSPSSRPCEFSG